MAKEPNIEVDGSILEALFFYLYNEKFHPFQKILLPDTPLPDEIPNIILFY